MRFFSGPSEIRAPRAQLEHQAHEAAHVGVPREAAPVEPARFVVLAVGIVVAALRAPDFVAHEKQRRADGEQRERDEVLHLAVAQALDRDVVARPFHAAVPAQIEVVPVAVAFAVRLVVLAIVRHEIVQREAVVAGYEVDALLRLALLMAVEVRAAEQAPRKAPRGRGVALHEAAHVVPEAAVPLFPVVADERAELIEAGRVPGLGDQLRAGEHRIGFDIPQHGRVLERPAFLVAREDRGEVEAKAVHVHAFDPVAQAVDDEPAHDRLIPVERVAGAAVIGVARRVVLQDVVRRVLEPPVAQRRAQVIALGRMVERHVEDDLDPGAMQRLHHVAELVERAEGSRARAVGRVGREKGERRVAPVVREPRRRILRVELEHGQELHRGDAQVLKIGDLVDQPPVSPARLRGQPGARVAREAAHVQLVDDGVKKRTLQRDVAFPVVRLRVGNDALDRNGAVVSRPRGRAPAVALRHRHGLAVGIEQHLRRVEAQAPLGIEGPVRAVAVDLPGAQAGHESVPVVVRPVPRGVERDDGARPGVVRAVEKQELHVRAALRVDAEVDPLGRERRSQRCGLARFDR